MPLLTLLVKREAKTVAGATGFEPAVSCVTGRCVEPGYTTPPSEERSRTAHYTCPVDNGSMTTRDPDRTLNGACGLRRA